MHSSLRKISLIAFIFSLPASAAPTAKLYEKGTGRKSPLYLWKMEEEFKEGRETSRGIYSALDGTTVVIEEATFKGDKLEQYTVDHKQLGEYGKAQVRDGKVFFEYTKNGRTETADETLTDNFTVAMSLYRYLKARRENLIQGDTVPVRFAVLERSETVGFKLFKEEEFQQDGQAMLKVKMKASSFIIAAFVDPLIFVFEKETFRMRELTGRTLPKKKVGKDWKDLDAEFIYDYQ